MIEWLLGRIESLKDCGPNRWATHRNIWAGSYDVWCCEQDRIDAVEIPKAMMQQAIDAGYIASEIKSVRKYNYEVWHLTEAGKVRLTGMVTRITLDDFIKWRLDKIERTAYLKWEEAGCPLNQDLHFWTEAERDFSLPQSIAEVMGHGYGADDPGFISLLEHYKATH